MAGAATEAGTKLAGDVIAHIAAALGTPLLATETIVAKKNRTTVTKASLPAWFVVGGLVGGAVALWISGMGLAPTTDANGRGRVTLTQRPRLSFSLFGNGGGSGSPVPDPIGAVVGFGEWLFHFTPL